MPTLSNVYVLQEAEKPKESDKGKGGDKDANAKAEDAKVGKGKASEAKDSKVKEKAAEDANVADVEMKDASFDKVCRRPVTCSALHAVEGSYCVSPLIMGC